ncbi:hypothetical protein ALT721_1310090 [Alteromonas alvinellae]
MLFTVIPLEMCIYNQRLELVKKSALRFTYSFNLYGNQQRAVIEVLSL